jgi:D-alanine--poly(phosphoribitol) ligase subunit 2
VTDANAVIQQLGTVFVEHFHIEAPSPDTDLLENGILDSFQFVELLVQLEQRFSLRIKIDDIDLDDLRTLARIARLVAARGGSADRSAAQPTWRAAD